MVTKIQKWGNSLGLRIPKGLAEDVGVGAGAAVDLSVENGRLVVAPAKKPLYDLKGLLGRITPDNRHSEADFGEPVGGEVW